MRIAGLRLLASLRMLAAVAGFAAAATTQAATWVVQTTAEAPIGTPNCSAGTCATLRDAIAKAASGDTITFTAGIDGQTIDLDHYHDAPAGRAAFLIDNRTLTIDAAAGLANGVVIERKYPFGTDPVTPFRLFNVASGGHLTLRGLRLRNGDALGGGSSFGGGALGAGGAIFNQGFVSIERCTFDGNLARGGNAGSPYEGFYGGGGMGEFSRSARGGGPNAGEGGRTGIYFVLDDGHGTPPHTVIEDGGNGSNGGFAGGGGKGGEAGDTQHKAGNGGDGGFGGGGGMAGGGGSTPGAQGGKGGFGGGAGGGIYNAPSVSGGFGGGAAYGGNGSGDGGAGAGMGGAIFNDGGRVIVVNSTFTDNHARGGSADAAQGQGAGFGGAIFNYDGRLDIAFTTLAGNGVAGGTPEAGSAAHPGAADGGAVYSLGDATAWNGNAGLFLSANADLTFSHAIAAGSIGASHDIVVGTIAGGSASSSGGGNLVMSHSGLTAGIVSVADPQLAALVAGGGLASVMLPQTGSPAIDAAGACGGSVFIDQRGVTRPQGAACDIGAVEVALPPMQFSGTVTVTTLADSVANDGVCSLREAVAVVNGTGNAAALGCDVGTSDYNAILFAPALAGGSIDSANGPIEILGTTQVAINACAVAQPGIESCAAARIRFGNAPAWRLLTIDSGAQVAILHLTFAGGGVIDTSNTDGAAIANAGTLVLQDVAIEHVVGAQHGGAIANSGWLGAFNSRFVGNQAYVGGGAISSSGTLLLYHTELSGNQAGSSGGAVDVQGGGATIIDSNISANYSQSGGGGIRVAAGATLDLSASTLSANRAIVVGGGIASAGTLSVVNSTLQGNSIDNLGFASGRKGGAIFVAGGTATIQSSTIAGNTTQGGSGDGIHRDAGSVGVSDSIVTDNGNGNCAGGIGDGGGNLSHGDASCAGFTQGDPMLGALADNGGPTPTMLPASGSAAIDRIACSQALDQRGIVRPQGTACDIGAVEVAVPRELSVGVIGQGTVSAAALPAPLVGAIAACDSAGITCTAGYAQGAVVTLVASAAPGWTLSAWSGEGCSDNGDGSASVAVVADYVCTATFAQDATASTIAATLTPTASVYGQPVTLDVSVLPQAGRPVPTGNLALVIDGASYSMLLDANGHWSQAVAYATPGTHAIRLAYDGDANTLAAAAVDLSLTTINASTHLVTSAPASVALGEALNVGVQALADAPSTYAPTGTIVVSDSDGDTCTIDLASATACALHPASTGKKTISAHYAGDIGFDGSDAAAFTVQVTPTQTFSVSGMAGPHGSITPATQAVNSGGAATFTITPDAGYTATLSGTCPAGTFVDSSYTTGLITADCAVLVIFAGVDDPLALLVSDGKAYARYGQTLRYLVMVSNNTGNDIGSLRLDAGASPDLDNPAGSWCTVGGTADAPTCTPTGSGPFSVPAFGVPAHGTMLWLMSVPVLDSAPDASADYRVTLTGPTLPAAIARTDSDTLVLFRDGFDHDGGDGTGEAPGP